MEKSMIDILWARAQIDDALNNYCMGVDLRDEQMFLEAFHPDAVLIYGTNTPTPWSHVGHEQISALIQVSASRWVDCHHMGTNPVIRFSDDFVTATVVSRALAVYTTEDLIHLNSIGRYSDKFTLRDGRWKIQERKVEHRFRATYLRPKPELDYVVNPPSMKSDFLAELRAKRESELP